MVVFLAIRFKAASVVVHLLYVVGREVGIVPIKVRGKSIWVF